MLPEKLFSLHSAKAERLAERLCWHYQIAGTRQWEEEAKSEALIGLWKACIKFRPRRQVMERRREVQEISKTYWSVIAKHAREPKTSQSDPYKTFWLYAVSRVRGAVIDFFRSHKLINRLPDSGEGGAIRCERCNEVMPKSGSIECLDGGFCRAPRTMLYHERFLSASRACVLPGLSDAAEQGKHGETDYMDVFASPPVASYNDSLSVLCGELMAQARTNLDETEFKLVEMLCGGNGLGRQDIAEELHWSLSRVDKVLAGAAQKMSIPLY